MKDLKFLGTIGEGTFCFVEKVEVNGRVYAGKRFRSDCTFDRKRLLSEFCIAQNLEHDHIVKYFGYHLPKHSKHERWSPVLIMEFLTANLHDVLLSDFHQDLLLSRKLNLLYGIAQGLNYLHSNGVIHCNLTARNVLLDSRAIPKISDFGSSCITGVDLRSELHSQSLIQCPGTLNYMAPEALSSTKYGAEIDVFSFGHLSLFICIQAHPTHLLPPNYPEGDESGNDLIRGRTEVERRQEYFKVLYGKIEENHPLVLLVKNCLRNSPKRRPKAHELVSQLDVMCKELQPPPPLFVKNKHASILQGKSFEGKLVFEIGL